MSIIIDWQESMLKDCSLKPNSKFIAMYLRTFMNAKSDMAWPSLARITAETGLARATVCRHLGYLDESGWITRNRGTIGKNTEYIAVFPKPIEDQLGSLTARLGDSEVVSQRDQGSLTVRPEVVSQRDTNNQVNNQTITNSTNASTNASTKEAFEEFWESYPKKVDKKKSQAKFMKLKPAIQRLAIENVKARAESDQQWTEGFAPNPTTYLNGERWDDEWVKEDSVPAWRKELGYYE